MSFFEDAWDWSVDAVEDVYDATARPVLGVSEDALRALPGGNEAIKLVHDFANTGVGETALRAFTTYVYTVLAWTPLGPQFASVAFAIPGLMKGDRFDEAWLVEFKYRAETTASILLPGAADQLGAQLTDALKKIANDYHVGDIVDLTVQEVAKRYNVREDVAAFAVALWNRVQLPPRDAFDASTGRLVRPWSASPNAANRAADEQRREYLALYGAREYDVLGFAERERAVLVAADAPRSSATSSSSSFGVLALVAVAAGAVVAWRRGLL